MTNDNVQNRTRAGSAGAVEAVVAAMSSHPLNVSVQREACVALEIMTDADLQNQTRAGDAGATEAVLAVITAQPLSASTQFAVRFALAMLTRGNLVNNPRVVDAGAVGALNTALASIQGTNDTDYRDNIRALLLLLAPP
mmetsp:Transcript_15524/g.37596  ORF Transcript_15524/g.37596 Transcript_15524/m.37596 type:complete len:139 (-) Transcript_15524:159-575(-)